MKKSYEALPAGYTLLRRVDLAKNKRELLLVNGLSVLLFLVSFVPMLFAVSPASLFRGEWWQILVCLGFFLFGDILYILLHEAVHGIFIRVFGGRPFFGFTGLYAYAGCKSYFARLPYLWIALSPVVIWGAVLGVLCVLSLLGILPYSLFWLFYLIECHNLSGAAGDFYVAFLFSRMPEDILVLDDGVAMSVYAKEEE